MEHTTIEKKIVEKYRTQKIPQWIPSSTQHSDREYIEVFLRQDSERRIYRREDYDTITYLGDLGGLFEIVRAFGMVITSPFVARLFYAALVSNVYLIQSYLRDMTPYYETKKKDGKLTTESGSFDSAASDKNKKEHEKKNSNPITTEEHSKESMGKSSLIADFQSNLEKP